MTDLPRPNSVNEHDGYLLFTIGDGRMWTPERIDVVFAMLIGWFMGGLTASVTIWLMLP